MIETNLGQVTFITTGKLDANAQDANGLYPFFTCGEENLTINTAAFDTEAVLLAGNGNFSVKYYKGKFNAYQRTYVIEPNMVDGKWLYYLVMHHIAKITAGARGSTIKYLRIGDITDCSVNLVSLTHQKRIVAKIEELFSELDNGIAALKSAREQLKVYRQAVLKHAFEGKLTAKWREENADKLESPEQFLARIHQEREARYQQQLEEWKAAVTAWEENGKEGKKPSKPKEPEKAQFEDAKFQIPISWATTKLGFITEVSGGLTKNQKRNTLPQKMKYLRVANVYADKLLLDDIQEIGVTEAEAIKVSLVLNDLLVVEGNGSVDQIGRVALWDASIENCGHQNHLIRVRFDNPDYARFIMLFLLSPIGRDLIVKEASSTSGLHTLSISKVSNLQIPLISLSESDQLMKIVDEKLTLASKFESELDTELQRAETLRQSILKKAFSGQLVPQDPNDEPASELLARIQAEREATKTKSTKKARKAK
ncbi:restriction endonuclease subunit S [Denitrificimonas caeni]|uniref:Restriction endonuclease subunit S n=1 Tax=Denitrificimonas caeni TaxID=521720 RepID=A0AAE9VV61_9GAMM|nr:restriction endonuclease subunit S [Denitrificimonas caeni]WBE26579.1 restriction endonuclease subunit S [Denitrificimonas caeni]